jgi:hypothetical protein
VVHRSPLASALLGGLVLLALGAGGRAAAAPQPMTRAEIIGLAQSGMSYSYWWGHGCWRTDGAQLGSCSGSCPDCTHSGSYGADCSGFAGKVWQIPSPSAVSADAHPYATTNFRWDMTWWDEIGRDQAEAADAFVYNSGGSGHIFIYESGDPWGSLWAYECKGCSYGCVHNLRTASSSYVAIRRQLIDEAATTGTLSGFVYEDLGTGDQSQRLPGATVSIPGQGSATARAGDAVFSFTLPPGSHTATASLAGFTSRSRACTVTAGATTSCPIGLPALCTPDCASRACGPDPVCGGSCGTCPSGQSCDASGQCVSCQPQCGGRQCGPDPVCGVSCGTCGAGLHCNASGACDASQCLPDCTGRVCGLDPVCSESCGPCPVDRACDWAGQCQPISTTMAKFYGTVFVATRTAGALVEETVSGADVVADTGETTRSDHAGGFELLLSPGGHTLTGTASGLTSAATTCRAGAGGAVECSIVLGGLADEGDGAMVVGTCAASRAPGSPALLLLGLALLALLGRRRAGGRRRPRA